VRQRDYAGGGHGHKETAKWLMEKGYTEDTEYEQERAREAAKDLPNASIVVDLLEAAHEEKRTYRILYRILQQNCNIWQKTKTASRFTTRC
jgi:hypothetical protein